MFVVTSEGKHSEAGMQAGRFPSGLPVAVQCTHGKRVVSESESASTNPCLMSLKPLSAHTSASTEASLCLGVLCCHTVLQAGVCMWHYWCMCAARA